jgi:hypothetical protein
MDETLFKKIEELERKIDATRESTEKIRKYFFWFLILSLLALFLPLFGMMIALPYFLNLFSASLPAGL